MRAGISWLLVVGGNILVVGCGREYLGCMRAGISWLYASGNILVVGCVFTDVQFSFSF